MLRLWVATSLRSSPRSPSASRSTSGRRLCYSQLLQVLVSPLTRSSPSPRSPAARSGYEQTNQLAGELDVPDIFRLDVVGRFNVLGWSFDGLAYSMQLNVCSGT